MSEVNITYETLFELLRREKNRDELQKLENGFFSDVADYLKEKGESLEELKKKQDLFAGEEKEKSEKQIENIRKILKELYEKREKKMIDMALDASRTSSVVIDTSNMLDEERLFYENTLDVLNTFRQGVLLNLQHANTPKIEKSEIKVNETKEEPEVEQEKPKSELESVKFTHDVPKFVGPDLQEYGPFQEGDTAELPSKVADVLINKGRAEES
ncbi:hypothetical protein GOV06_01260 [Candidatus Woesearchaeota archaeon]|nr:hypothetical protein [Candidatus Woesearchaeota archaeon]